jgi:hypothetical protein
VNNQLEGEMMFLDFGDEFKAAWIMDAAFRLWFKNCQTKDDFFKVCNEYRDLIVQFGWQNDVNEYYKKWKQ